MTLTPLADARRVVLDAVVPTPIVDLALADAAGRVAADSVTAPRPVRPFTSSAMDGFAVRAADTPGTLPVVADVAAGAAPGALRPGEAARISTGARLPDGADAVVRSERAHEVDGKVQVDLAVEAGTDVRPAGADLAAGTLLAAAGAALGPAHLAALASAGIATVRVHRAPRVGVLATGDELADPGPTHPAAGAPTFDANRPLLRARVESLGAEAIDGGIVVDDPDRLAAALAELADACDLVVVTGGAGHGAHDHIAGVLETHGPVHDLRLALRPGKPFVLGAVTSNRPTGKVSVPVAGLPGNPLAAATTFELLVRPAIRRLSGLHEPVEPLRSARAGAPVAARNDGRIQAVPVTVRDDGDGTRTAEPITERGSHQVIGLSRAEGLALIGPEGARPGDVIDYLPL